MGFLNKEFMPLAHECIDLAQQAAPGLQGTLALDLHAVADPGLGAAIDVAGAAANNQVADPDLLECIRESAFSLHLPPSAATGRVMFLLTLPIEARSDGGGQ